PLLSQKIEETPAKPIKDPDPQRTARKQRKPTIIRDRPNGEYRTSCKTPADQYQILKTQN
ncbi:MAG TPA: hypothetical protein O0X27_03865, partial [Methanocorpusculum sp.]|nr:hypothetical protein [Methanocorpusculum sp.]